MNSSYVGNFSFREGHEAVVKDILSHFKNIAKANDPGLKTSGVESVKAAAAPDLSDDVIDQRIEETREEYRKVIQDVFGNRSDLLALVNEITDGAGEALRALGQEDVAALLDRRSRSGVPLLESLEGIVRLDGSRPSFLIQNGAINRQSSPEGAWSSTLDVSAESLQKAFACVGRIDYPLQSPGYVGTGFLVHERLIVTNRHVLQEIADPQPDGTWIISEEATIDFGHEFRVKKPSVRRQLKAVVFAASQNIDPEKIDHNKLDLVLIELEKPQSISDIPSMLLAINGTLEWSQPDETLFVIGYPGRPNEGIYAPTLIEQLFIATSTFGYKRLAPGLALTSQLGFPASSMAHDATTLGGNSGSVILAKGKEHLAAGLHYGGRFGASPLENWAHILHRNLDRPNGFKINGNPEKTLRDLFNGWGVEVIDTLGHLNPPNV